MNEKIFIAQGFSDSTFHSLRIKLDFLGYDYIDGRSLYKKEKYEALLSCSAVVFPVNIMNVDVENDLGYEGYDTIISLSKDCGISILGISDIDRPCAEKLVKEALKDSEGTLCSGLIGGYLRNE